jgi:hypothetical protein
MGNILPIPVIPTAPTSSVHPASALVTPKIPFSFVYEDLVSHVQAILHQMVEIEQFLAYAWENERTIQNELKSRSLIFVDPYGNEMVNKHMDHEMISTVFRKYKKDYVPKYLQPWIKLGRMNGNSILPLSDSELKSIVSKYADGYRFITYGEVIVWVGDYEKLPPRKLVVQVLLTDNMEKIKMRIKKPRKYVYIELRLFTINENAGPNTMNWDAGTTLQLEDSIMSSKLYQDNCVVMAKVIKEKVSCDLLFSCHFT